MNIFYLHPEPALAAQYHCDAHCGKMLIEYAQLLSTAHRLSDSDQSEQCYKAAYKNHPSTVWTRDSAANYRWLYSLWSALAEEFHKRRGKHHASWLKLRDVLANVPEALPSTQFQEPPQCMPDEYKRPGDSVSAYRDYYLQDKSRFARWDWPNSQTPDWWTPSAN